MSDEAENRPSGDMEVEPQGMQLDAMITSGAKINMKAMKPEERGVVIHDIMQKLQAENRAKDIAWVKLGMLWSFIIKNRLYRYCGEHIRNANDFLREVDLGVKRRELEYYASLATIFGRILRQRNVQVPIHKLALIQPMINKGGDPEEWVEKALSLPVRALEDEVREATGRQPQDACAHPENRQEVWMRCGVCGKWIERVQAGTE